MVVKAIHPAATATGQRRRAGLEARRTTGCGELIRAMILAWRNGGGWRRIRGAAVAERRRTLS